MTNIESKYLSKLKLKSIYFEDIKFSFQPLYGETKLSYDFDTGFEEQENKTIKVVLSSELSADNKMLSLTVKLVAIFDFDGDDFDVIRQNAISIMFPYLRAQITTMTCQPGLRPIVIPPININAYFEDKYNKVEPE